MHAPLRSRSFLSVLVVVGTLLAGCSSSEEAAPAPTDPTGAVRPPVVLLVSVDGLNPEAITTLDARGEVPTLRLLMREGASTLNARTAYEQTNTLPNHTGILTGRPISGPRGTGVTFNDNRPGTLASLRGRYLPGVFDPVHDAGGSTLFLAEKTKFAFLTRSWKAGLDSSAIDDDPARLTARLLRRLRTDPPRLTFLHVSGPDEAGHADRTAGFMGPGYLDAVAAADDQLGAVLEEIRSNPDLAGRTTVVLTADHGGRGTDAGPGGAHRVPDRLDNYRIPFIVWGPGVPGGADLYDLNAAGRADPGTARVGYAGRQPIRNLDAANLVLAVLGLPPLPGTRPGGLPVLLRQ